MLTTLTIVSLDQGRIYEIPYADQDERAMAEAALLSGAQPDASHRQAASSEDGRLARLFGWLAAPLLAPHLVG